MSNSNNLTFLDRNCHGNAVVIDKHPDNCPVCNTGIQVEFITACGKAEKYDRGYYVQVIFRCPRNDCQAIFIAYYTSPSWYGNHNNFDRERIYLRNTFIRSYFEEEKFDEEIVNLSSRFVGIFTQSSIAENMGLTDICGMGYRKALEFLVKDYLSKIIPEKKKEISASTLGNLIYNKIDDDKIRKMAKLAKDIGNNETHYEDSLNQLTLEDMKKLIKLVIYWISSSLLTEEYSKIHDQLTGNSDKIS
ncbi:MAG: DUF4145 domain-containing protein [bacterium]|nr:DUF4145 domain-containing protein [bacterium]